MAPPPKKSRWRRLRHALFVMLGVGLLAAAAGMIFIWTGAADRVARRAIVHRLETMTGATVELQRFHFDWWHFRADLWGLVIHGREPSGTPPFFQARQLHLDIHVDSFFRKKISLEELILSGVEVRVRVDANGSSNLPSPARASSASRPLRERLFALAIRKVRLEDGIILFDDAKFPLAAQAGQSSVSLDAGTTDG